MVTKSARVSPSGFFRKHLEKKIRYLTSNFDPGSFNWDSYYPTTSSNIIQKGIILKTPVSEKEKGVLFIAFEDQWLRFIRNANLAKLSMHYDLVIAPTWSPPHDVPIQIMSKMWPTKLYHILSSFEDFPTFKNLSENLISIPLISSNWVNPELFDIRKPMDKEYDIVMLANFARYKRHFLLFDTLRRMPSSTRVLLLGSRWEGRTVETLREEARVYGVENNITIKERLPDKELMDALRSAKVSLIFSGNEGACVAVVESMFLDVPVGIFANANIGSKFYINEQTGRLFQSNNIADQITEFVELYQNYSPRKYVIDNNISCMGSTKILNDALRVSALNSGKKWTVDIVPHHWRPNPTYVFREDVYKFKDVYRQFLNEFNCEILPRDHKGENITFQ